ncbi:ArnT family glycosyltransferase [Hymenobacter negativus]|uniref:Glycosyltransferase family 39 protein n=1 Tax=Hymenobacter negativus TaxID=2795026 RepID=A0ABS0Q8L0_9BACT|nr:glycosyltransferase family 39 protein [Hymenobacter negativus]MBH8559018.1 glycosyltransferase family 39 protein [Hymenobacter negativus]
MAPVLPWLRARPWVPAVLALLMLPPALLLNLGLLPLIADEPIRALVALELKLHGNFFVSTLQGEYYFNKPPLFNWLLLGFFRLFGSVEEWVIRLPTVLALLGMGASLYYFVSRRLGRMLGVAAALAFVTSGRMLFYDSFLGLIDTLHALVTYLGFMAVFELGARRRWAALFVVSYALTAVGFLLKGLPSLVFQGVALGVYFGLVDGHWRRLLSGAHALGLGVLLGLAGGYFAVYSHFHPLHDYLATLLDQSTQRTVAAHAWRESLAHLVKFPFDFISDFLPWTLLLLCLVRPGWRQVLRGRPFLRYNALLFVALTPVFWLSPGTIPRYLFVLTPLGFTVAVYFYQQFRAESRWPHRVLDTVLLTAMALVSLSLVAVPWIPAAAVQPGVAWKSGLGVLALAGCTLAFWYLPAQRLAWLGLFLLCMRVVFNWFVLPARLLTRDETPYRTAAIRVAQIAGSAPVYKLADTHVDNDEAFYITRGTGHIVYSSTSPLLPAAPAKNAFYLAEDRYLTGRRYRQYYEFVIDRGIRLHLVKFDQSDLFSSSNR